jgi:hypothetical protein
MAAAAATAVVNPLELVVSTVSAFSLPIVPRFQLVLTLPSPSRIVDFDFFFYRLSYDLLLPMLCLLQWSQRCRIEQW